MSGAACRPAGCPEAPHRSVTVNMRDMHVPCQTRRATSLHITVPPYGRKVLAFWQIRPEGGGPFTGRSPPGLPFWQVRRGLGGDFGMESAILTGTRRGAMPFWQEAWRRICHSGRTGVSQITARNRLNSTGTVRSVALAVGGHPIPMYQNSGRMAPNSGNPISWTADAPEGLVCGSVGQVLHQHAVLRVCVGLAGPKPPRPQRVCLYYRYKLQSRRERAQDRGPGRESCECNRPRYSSVGLPGQGCRPDRDSWVMTRVTLPRAGRWDGERSPGNAPPRHGPPTFPPLVVTGIPFTPLHRSQADT